MAKGLRSKGIFACSKKRCEWSDDVFNLIYLDSHLHCVLFCRSLSPTEIHAQALSLLRMEYLWVHALMLGSFCGPDVLITAVFFFSEQFNSIGGYYFLMGRLSS